MSSWFVWISSRTNLQILIINSCQCREYNTGVNYLPGMFISRTALLYRHMNQQNIDISSYTKAVQVSRCTNVRYDLDDNIFLINTSVVLLSSRPISSHGGWRARPRWGGFQVHSSGPAPRRGPLRHLRGHEVSSHGRMSAKQSAERMWMMQQRLRACMAEVLMQMRPGAWAVQMVWPSCCDGWHFDFLDFGLLKTFCFCPPVLEPDFDLEEKKENKRR